MAPLRAGRHSLSMKFWSCMWASVASDPLVSLAESQRIRSSERRTDDGFRTIAWRRVPMTMTSDELATAAADHLWLHFSRLSGEPATPPLTVIERGEGAYVWDSDGKRYLDGLAGLFVVQAGHGRQEIAEAAAAQAEKLGYFPLWTYAHPTAIELAARLAALAPGDLNRVFFTTGGGEAVESAWKLARQYFLAIGQPERVKVISRHTAYHGTTLGALNITGLDAIKEPFLPLLNGQGRHVPNTLDGPAARTPTTPLAGADAIEAMIIAEGPETVAAVYLEPVQNAGGCLVPPDGLLPAGARDLRPPRRAARERRGDLRLRPPRRLVRREPPRLPARHDHLRQGGHLGLRARSAACW